MRRLLILLFFAVFMPVLAAKAQDSAVSFAPPRAAAAAPQTFGGGDYPRNQLAIGYQFNGIRLTDQTATSSGKFHTSGFNISAVRYVNDWFGFEAQIGFGFGHTGTATTPNNLVAKSVFFSGGPHISFRSSSRWEP